MKTRHLTLALAALTITPEALAQSHVHVSIERTFGFVYNRVTESSETTMGSTTVTRESTAEWNSLNLLGSGVTGAVPGLGTYPWSNLLPRLAVDYELDSHLTLGGALFLTWSSLASNGTTGSTFGFGIAPRVGYMLHLSDRLSFWPRGGMTLGYFSASPDVGPTGVGVTVSQSTRYVPLWVNIEPTLVINIERHFAFTVGIIGDLPLTGGATTETTTTTGSTTVTRTVDSKLTQLIIAAQVGVMGTF